MDISSIVPWFNSVTTFFQHVWDFMDSGIYKFFKDMFVIVVKFMIYSYLEFKIFMLDIAYQVVLEIMAETGVVALVQSAWSSIPADMQSMLAFFNIPQGLTLIFAAIPTKWAMRFLPS